MLSVTCKPFLLNVNILNVIILSVMVPLLEFICRVTTKYTRFMYYWRHGMQHNDTQYYDIQHNNTQHNYTQNNKTAY